MLRKFLRRYIPDGETIRSKRYLAWMGSWLHHPCLWALNRESVAGAVAIGLFAGLVPGPLQMLTAALLAIPLRKNLPVALFTTVYTNPFTIAPLYLLAYGYGRLLVGAGDYAEFRHFEWDWSDWAHSTRAMLDWGISLGRPLAVGLLALALTLAAAGYFAVKLAWRVHVVRAWRARARRRSAQRA
jgi:hypothetical protein